MFCCRTPNRQPATISYFRLIGNWLKRRVRFIRDGPLENLWGGGGAGEVQKKKSRKGKLNEKKFLHAN